MQAAAAVAGVVPLQAPVYQLRNVGKTYARNSIKALESVNLTLTKGSSSALIGSNGCVKPTLLKIMSGLISPLIGRVVAQGKPRRDIGMMFQQATLFPWRTTLENIVLPIEIRDGRTAARAARNKARALLELVGLKGSSTPIPANCQAGWRGAPRSAGC